jgi:HSP20 family protein
MYETADSFHVEMAVTGMRPEDLEITVQENTLMISGEFKREYQQEPQGQQQGQQGTRNYHVSERHYGRFMRSIALPTQIKADAITATCENGLVKINLPKAEEVKPRKINVQIGQQNQRTLEAGGSGKQNK